MPTHPRLDTVEDEAEGNNCPNEDTNNHANVFSGITLYKGVTTGFHIVDIDTDCKGKGKEE